MSDYFDSDLVVYFGSYNGFSFTNSSYRIEGFDSSTYANDFVILNEFELLIITDEGSDDWFIVDIEAQTNYSISPFINGALTIDVYQDSILAIGTSDSLFITNMTGNIRARHPIVNAASYGYADDGTVSYYEEQRLYLFNLYDLSLDTLVTPDMVDYYIDRDTFIAMTDDQVGNVDQAGVFIPSSQLIKRPNYTPVEILNPVNYNDRKVTPVISTISRPFSVLSEPRDVMNDLFQYYPYTIFAGLEPNSASLSNLNTQFIGYDTINVNINPNTNDTTYSKIPLFKWEVNITAGPDNGDEIIKGIIASNPLENLFDCFDTRVFETFQMPRNGETMTLSDTLSLRQANDLDLCLYIHSINDRPNQNSNEEALCTFLTSTTEFQQKVARELKLYPNPTQDRLYIQSKSSIDLIEIYDMAGRLMCITFSPIDYIDVSFFPVGMFTVTVLTNGERMHERFVKL